jgi:SAM-dependent methyltransferase
MQNRENWRPTKFVPTKSGRWIASNEIGPGSRFVANVQIKAYMPIIREHARGRLCDLGCGKVPLYGIYRDLVREVVCIDWANSLHDSPYLDALADLNQPLPIPSESFDTLLLTDVLEHIAKPELLWDEIVRILAPAGRLILAVPFFYWLHETPYDFHRFTKYKLSELCAESGLKIILLQEYGGSPEIFFDLVSKHIGRFRYPANAWAWIAGRVANLGAVRRLSRKTSSHFPLGYCLVAEKLPSA